MNCCFTDTFVGDHNQFMITKLDLTGSVIDSKMLSRFSHYLPKLTDLQLDTDFCSAKEVFDLFHSLQRLTLNKENYLLLLYAANDESTRLVQDKHIMKTAMKYDSKAVEFLLMFYNWRLIFSLQICQKIYTNSFF